MCVFSGWAGAPMAGIYSFFPEESRAPPGYLTRHLLPPPPNDEATVGSDLDGGDPLKNSWPGAVDHMSGDIVYSFISRTLFPQSLGKKKK